MDTGIVTVHTDLRIYCAGRKKVIRECKNPIAEGNFRWIFACYWSRSEHLLEMSNRVTSETIDNVKQLIYNIGERR